MPSAEFIIEKLEATYRLICNPTKHFAIDCGCKGKEGTYHGSRYKKPTPLAQQNLERQKKDHQRRRINPEKDHTFYQSGILFEADIENHMTRNHGEPLTVICNDCQREFPFTKESYTTLLDLLETEPDKRKFS
ncbi:MAG TPA: hypothetical protein VJB87_01270 [Candidatus Nanoarchaeia archaeon]|nr:hypothetical protein [Candidatus Nanoarchaeia archaeon]